VGLLSKSFIKIAKAIQQMSKITAMAILLLGVILGVAACSGQDTQRPVKATWIMPQVTDDTVSIPVSEVNNNKIVHFNVADALGSEMTFMAYELDGKLNIRANVCPPCRSIGFSLNKNTLVCDTCQTTFKAKTGEGISGACVGFPKASVRYEINDGKIVVRGSDLISAYQNTIEPGWP
jgi:uncharacterized membrane protein